jgi:hypothetical protein
VVHIWVRATLDYDDARTFAEQLTPKYAAAPRSSSRSLQAAPARAQPVGGAGRDDRKVDVRHARQQLAASQRWRSGVPAERRTSR